MPLWELHSGRLLQDHKYKTKVVVTYSDKDNSLPGLMNKINYNGKIALKVEPRESYTQEGSGRITNVRLRCK